MSKVIKYKKKLIYQNALIEELPRTHSATIKPPIRRVKSPSKQFSYSKIALYTVHFIACDTIQDNK